MESELNKVNSIEPAAEKFQPIIDLYAKGEIEQALFLINEIQEEFPNSAFLHDFAGACNAELMNFKAAIHCYEEAIRNRPNFSDAHNNMGNVLIKIGNLDEAIKSFKQAVKIEPNYANAHFNLANAKFDKSDFIGAEKEYRLAIKYDTENQYAYFMLANLKRDQGIFNEAIDCYEQAIKINPEYAEAFNNLGNVLKVKSETEEVDLDKAIDCYEQAIKINPEYAEAYNNMGTVLRAKGKVDQAILSFKKALSISSNFSIAHNNLGNALKDKESFNEALESFREAIKIQPFNPEAFYNLGATLHEKGDVDLAIDSYKKAIKLKPDYAEAYNNLGIAMQDKGSSEVAIDSYKQAIKIKPDYTLAFRNLTNIHRYKERDEYFLKMQKLCQDPLISDEQRCDLHFALSKASEDLNEVSQSFNYLTTGNELRKKILSYDIEQDIELFSQLQKAYPSIALNSSVEKSDLKPIFILGMPRSGTTLVEQIVSSHSEVTGAGELYYIDSFGESIARGEIKSSVDVISDFKKNYIQALKTKSNGKSIVTDKMPQNFLYIGLIFSAFPDAKIIHVKRDPAATCWSNYKHYFTSEGLGYAYDIDDIARYFGLYQDLMQFWRSHYGNRVYNLNYDNLTINQEEETRSLLQYLELKWESGCLSPQKNKRSVQTASQQQVRQKVYQGSSQQWRKFEPFIKGAFDQLTEL